MPVQKRINMQVELGMLRRMPKMILFIIDQLMANPDGGALQITVNSVKVSARALAQHIQQVDDDDINDHRADANVSDCQDSISTMLQAFNACCRSCGDMRKLLTDSRSFASDLSDEDIVMYREDCIRLCSAVNLAGQSCLNLAIGMRYDTESIHKIEESIEMVKPQNDTLEQLNGSPVTEKHGEDVSNYTPKPATRPKIRMGWGN